MKGLGTLINVATVLAGSGVGLLLGSRLPQRTRGLLTGGLGVVTVLVALDMARATSNILIVLGAVLLGGLVGDALGLEARLEALGRALETGLTRRGPARARAAASPGVAGPATHPAVPAEGAAASADPEPGAEARLRPVAGAPVPDPAATGSPAAGQRAAGGTLAQGFVAASLLFCVGPMTVLGSIQDGLRGDYQLLAVKAALDGFASIALASTLGAGVALSALTVLAVQGGLTLLAGFIAPWFSPAMLGELTAAGGAMVLMIGLSLLEIKRLPVANFLPALVVAPLLAWLASHLP